MSSDYNDGIPIFQAVFITDSATFVYCLTGFKRCFTKTPYGLPISALGKVGANENLHLFFFNQD